MFNNQINYLRKRFEIISFSEAVDKLKEGIDLQGKLVLKFDDGYKSNRFVAEKITKANIPFIIYLSTHYIENQELFWWDKIRILSKKNKIMLKRERKILQEIKNYPQEKREEKINEIIPLYFKIDDAKEILEKNKSGKEPLSWKDIEKLREYPVEFGAHSHQHLIITRTCSEALKKDLLLNKKLIEDKTGEECKHFAAPNAYYGEREINILKELNFISAVGKYDTNTRSQNLYDMKTIGISDNDTIPIIEAKISGFWYLLKAI